jgi:hypothetical protein
MTAPATPKRRASIRPVALPAEHGGWGFLLEPLALGLLVAPSLAGLCLAIGIIGAFLSHQPIKIVTADRRRGRRFVRTALAERFLLLYLAVSAAGFGLALILAGLDVLIPFLLAVPLAMGMLYYDTRNASRHWLPELLGPLALGTGATSIALAGGWPLLPAAMLWLILAARAIPSILYVRARLRQAKGQAVEPGPVIGSQLVALLLAMALAASRLIPWLVVLALGILAGRAVYGLRIQPQVPPKIIGLQELAFGLITVLLTALGYALI